MARGPAATTYALIVAAGRGSRASGAGASPKQFAMLGARTMLGHALTPFLAHEGIARALVVIAGGDEAAFGRVADNFDGAARAKLLPAVTGGATRQESVANGLEALGREPPEAVLIHDAARPFVARETISAVIDALRSHDGALPVARLADTVKELEGGRVARTLDRARLGLAQTPQGFRYAAIRDAHARARAEGRGDFTDDAGVAEWAGLAVAAVTGDPANVKVTTADDLEAAAARLAGAGHGLVARVGIGFDVHAFGPGEAVRLAGVDVPHSAGLTGHSDADVALHALCDAIYGALGAGDIGHHFPPSDDRWAGADSAVFLAHAAGLVAGRGGRIVHVDITIICERPRIGPHRDAMVTRLAGLLGLDEGAVSVKATTTEGLGFTGRGEGIAAQAAATVALPPGAADGT